MTQIEFFTQQIGSYFAQIEYPTTAHTLYEPIDYTLSDGGKRMRPLLCMLSAFIFNGLKEEVAQKTISAAVAVEIFHNFTLLHDDIMDSAPTRRGRPTVYKKWNENTAILSGDAMMILSYEMLSKAEKFADLFPIFNRAAKEVCEGQQFDMEFESAKSVSLEEYIEMIRLKTASLMAAAMKMGAVCGLATERECEVMYKYGESLGVAFQIQDDLLDSYGNSTTFGKQIGGDISEGKQTFLRIMALNSANQAQREILEKSRDYDEVIAVYDELGVEQVAKEKISRYFDLADSLLGEFDEQRVAPLREYSNFLLSRNW